MVSYLIRVLVDPGLCNYNQNRQNHWGIQTLPWLDTSKEDWGPWMSFILIFSINYQDLWLPDNEQSAQNCRTLF